VRESAVKPVGKLDAGNPHVRFDERDGKRGGAQASVLAPILDSTTCATCCLRAQRIAATNTEFVVFRKAA